MADPMADLKAKRAAVEKMLAQTVLDTTTKLTLDADKALKLASPVNTGTFRGAWTAETPTKPYDNGSVTNNTEYAKALANGHSPQAPAGWIENAVVAAVKGGGE